MYYITQTYYRPITDLLQTYYRHITDLLQYRCIIFHFFLIILINSMNTPLSKYIIKSDIIPYLILLSNHIPTITDLYHTSEIFISNHSLTISSTH